MPDSVYVSTSIFVPLFTRERYEGQQPLEGDVLLVRGGLRGHGLLTQLTGAGHGGATGGAVEMTLAAWIDIFEMGSFVVILCPKCQHLENKSE